jgi:predicted RNA polymerase sigma factor
MSDNPAVALNHAVAVAMVDGPRAGLDRLAGVESDGRLAGDHRVPAVRAQLLELLGDREQAIEAYDEAARRAKNLSQVRFLRTRAARLRDEVASSGAGDDR